MLYFYLNIFIVEFVAHILLAIHLVSSVMWVK